jgi:hypothetical protein
VLILFIVQALLLARTEYIVYFLLSTWLESIAHSGSARGMPHEIKALPVRDAADLSRRFAVVRQELCRRDLRTRLNVRALRHAAAVLGVACEKLRELSKSRRVTDGPRDGAGLVPRDRRAAPRHDDRRQSTGHRR